MLLLQAACGGPAGQLDRSSLAPEAEISATPFFSQQDYQCGPASLAMALNHAGQQVTPEALVPLVYLPEREGSLQADMLVTPARYELLGVRIEPALSALLELVAAGYPVVVLQNLALESLPAWHYAVAYGYDLDRHRIYLRSGTDPEVHVNLRRFAKTWSRAGNWAMVVVRPGQIPPAVTPDEYLKGVNVLERLQHYASAGRAYLAAARHWPDSALAWAGAGNSEYALGKFAEADAAYREALARDPENPLLMNNLAMALAERGCLPEALTVLDCALIKYPGHATLEASGREIGRFTGGGSDCQPFSCPFSAP